MFTGIVESVGRILEREARGALARLVVAAPGVTEGVRLGDSVAVNGTCLTVVRVADGQLAFDVVKETLDRTSLGALGEGDGVNLERALPASGRLDGHIVQGHVDGVGRVRSVERDGDDVRFAVDCGPEVARYLVPKGSVAIDGVSLTVVNAEPGGFDVALVPHTLAVTTLGARRSGDPVNLEADVLGKYVMHFLERRGSRGEGGS